MARVREKKQGMVFEGEASIRPDKSSEIGSQMCAPIIARGEIRGVVYLNRIREDINFNEEDLRTLLIFLQTHCHRGGQLREARPAGCREPERVGRQRPCIWRPDGPKDHSLR
jgi:hypothetical protein